MAKIVKIKSELKRETGTSFGRAYLFLIASVISFFGGIALLLISLNLKYALLFLLGFMFFIAYKNEHKKYMIKSYGVKGEKKVLETLKKLPSDFTVITNPVINNRGKYNELDFVVIGKNALFIVETKNYKGILKGISSNPELMQIKTDKNGKNLAKTVKNPIIQADMQAERMKELLYDLKIPYTVFPVLYFPNKYLKLDIYNDEPFECRLIKNEGSLLNYITKTKGDCKTNYSNNEKLINALRGNKIRA